MRRIRYVSLEGRPTNILVQAVGIVLGLIVFGIAIIVGGVLLAGLVAVALVAGLVLYARFWWLTRKTGRGDDEKRIVEAEYRVVETTQPNDRTDDKDRGPSE